MTSHSPHPLARKRLTLSQGERVLLFGYITSHLLPLGEGESVEGDG
jgi:hypothetical protein